MLNLKKSAVSKALRTLVFERDSYTCIFCNAAASEVHHYIKRSKGGNNTPHNLISVCRCHHLALHGERIQGIELTAGELEGYALQYLADAYADTPPSKDQPWYGFRPYNHDLERCPELLANVTKDVAAKLLTQQATHEQLARLVAELAAEHDPWQIESLLEQLGE